MFSNAGLAGAGSDLQIRPEDLGADWHGLLQVGTDEKRTAGKHRHAFEAIGSHWQNSAFVRCAEAVIVTVVQRGGASGGNRSGESAMTSY